MKFLLVMLALYFLGRFVFRYALPRYLENRLRDFQDKVQEQQRRYAEEQEPREEGKTVVIKKDESSSKNDDMGETDDYIDFEELD